MKFSSLLFVVFLLYTPTLSQAQSDTILFLQNITVDGTYLKGLSGGNIKRFDVERNQTGVTATAAEVFRQLPSVITDIEGAVNYRGSNKSSVLINGVPYGLLEEYSGDVLIQLPAIFFNRIELSTYPSISFIPDGDAGMINLLPAKYTRYDSPLQVTVGAGLEKRYNAGVIANLHPGKFHITGKYNYRREYRERTFYKLTTTSTGSTEMDNNASARPDVHLADLSVAYDLSPKDIVSIYGLYQLMEYNRYGGINNTRRNPAGEIMNKILRHRFNRQQQDAYAVEGRWSHFFTDPTDRVEVVFNYNNFTYDENNDFKNEKPETGAILAEDRSFIDHDKKNYYTSVSWQKLFLSNWLFKAGYIGHFRDEAYTMKAHDKREGLWLINDQKSNDYSFNRNIHLAYASFGKNFGGLATDVGLQAELSPFHIYPRVRLAYPIKGTDEIAISYIQRAIRPTGQDLNPFVDLTDATYIRQGNPDLKDEFIHSLEVSYQYNVANIHVSPAFYYRNRRNRMMDILTEQGEQTVWRKENLGNSQTIGFELSGNWNPIPVLSFIFSGDIYKDEIDGRTIGYDDKKSLVCWDVKGNAEVAITSSMSLQIDGFYISDQLTPQGEIDSRFGVNAGISQYLMQRKIRLNLSVQNIFDSLKETTRIDAENLQMKQVRNRDPRVTWLTLTYSL